MTFSQTNIQDLSSFSVDAEQKMVDMLTEELSKAVGQELLLDAFSPESKGLPFKERVKVMNRDMIISKIVGDGTNDKETQDFVEKYFKDYFGKSK